MLDIVHQPNVEQLKSFLARAKHRFPIQLIFTSPGGDGLKIVLSCSNLGPDYSTKYKEVADWWWRYFSIKVDKTSDITRAYFLSHNPLVWNNKGNDLDRMIKKHAIVKELVERFHLEEVKITRFLWVRLMS